MRKCSILLFLVFCAATVTVAGDSAKEFHAYHTNTVQPLAGQAGKYADLIVVFEGGKRLEFSRATGYLPQWRTADGVHSVEEFFPDRDQDPNCYYNYVRMIEDRPDRIVVRWRYFRDIKTLIQANKELDVLNPHGIVGAVHELFTIYPDGRIEREIGEAANTRFQDWNDPRLAARQSLRLTGKGIEHGPVKPGQKPPFFPRPAVLGNAVKTAKGLPHAAYRWTFDDGMKPHEDSVAEAVSGAACGIGGLMALFKKGVSGTALAFDGYYTGVTLNAEGATKDALTVEAWVALDVYPYNITPIVHQSKGFGEEGWYLGLDAYGHPLMTASALTVKAENTVLPLYEWTHVAATVGTGKMRLATSTIQFEQLSLEQAL